MKLECNWLKEKIQSFSFVMSECMIHVPVSASTSAIGGDSNFLLITTITGSYFVGRLSRIMLACSWCNTGSLTILSKSQIALILIRKSLIVLSSSVVQRNSMHNWWARALSTNGSIHESSPKLDGNGCIQALTKDCLW